MFFREFTLANHSLRYTVAPAAMGGWELRVMEDRALVKRTYFSDWHRVERAMGALEREMSELISKGWRVTGRDGDDVHSTNR
jgi:hypothetical protein